MKALIVVFAALASVTLGCTPHRYPPVEVSASDFDLRPLEGTWTGDYFSPTTGRTGSIVFTLQPGGTMAAGDIVMIPRSQVRMMAIQDGRPMTVTALGMTSQVLTIHFVRKEGNQVVGVLDSYTDPECDCRVATIFHGAFRDPHSIEGTFTTSVLATNELRATGRWTVSHLKFQ